MGTLPRAGRALAETLLVTTGAFATSAIPLCWHFQALSVGSFAASLLLLPIMPVLMLASLGQLAIPDLGIWALLIDGAMIALEGVVGLIDRLPGTPIRMGRPTPLAICMAVLVFGLLAWRLPRQRPEHRRRLFLTGSALAVLACFVNRTPEPGFRLLDVGHGLALLVSTDRGGHGLVDTGPGAEQAARQVRELGLKELDWVLITHDHRDHDGGLPGLARSLAIRRFHGVTEETALFRGDRIAGGRRVLWPPRGQPRGDENDRSVVVKLSAGGGRLLVTGDLESRGTRALLDCGDDLSCEVLLLPHHGAANEALTDLVLRAAPAELWIAGRESFVSPRTRLTLAWLGRDARTIRDGAGASWPSTSQLPKHESE